MVYGAAGNERPQLRRGRRGGSGWRLGSRSSDHKLRARHWTYVLKPKPRSSGGTWQAQHRPRVHARPPSLHCSAGAPPEALSRGLLASVPPACLSPTGGELLRPPREAPHRDTANAGSSKATASSCAPPASRDASRGTALPGKRLHPLTCRAGGGRPRAERKCPAPGPAQPRALPGRSGRPTAVPRWPPPHLRLTGSRAPSRSGCGTFLRELSQFGRGLFSPRPFRSAAGECRSESVRVSRFLTPNQLGTK